jgi:hypothetical protein
MNIDTLYKLFGEFVDTKLNSFCTTNPMLQLFKPVIKRVINVNFSKIHSKLSILADVNGDIDVKGILPEMIDNIKNMEPYTIQTEAIGDIIIGKGSIILNIPMTDRRLVINTSDLEELKNLINSN